MTAVSATRQGDDVLVLAIDHPPVNALATVVRERLFDALRHAENDPDVRAVVVSGGARLFSAGADLAEFDAGTAMDAPTLHADIVPLIAAMTKPVVAAVSGAALGGGLELALACHDRVFATGTRIGLPETTLGLMPGAGGTQVLPRAIGMQDACALIATGRVEAVDRFAGRPIAHAIVPADRVLDVAVEHARRLAVSGAPFAAIDGRPITDPAERNALARCVAGLDPSTLAPPGIRRALEAVAQTTTHTIATGMRLEFAMFEPLLATVESRALRHVFRAERRRKDDPAIERFERALIERFDAGYARACDDLAREGVAAARVAQALQNWGWSRAPSGRAVARPGDERLVARILEVAVAEGRRALSSGEAQASSDVDLAFVRRAAFPRIRGGPMFQADEAAWKERSTP